MVLEWCQNSTLGMAVSNRCNACAVLVFYKGIGGLC